MTDLEAIAARSSRRVFTGPLSQQEIRLLEAEIARVNLAGGLHCQLLVEGADAFGGVRSSYGMFSGVRSLIVVAGPAGDPNLAETAGHGGERLVLEATKHGIGSCWVGGTFDRQRVAATLPGGLELVAVIPVGPIKPDKSLVEKAVGVFTAGSRKKVESFCTVIQDDAPAWFYDGVAAAIKAPSALNRKPARFGWQNGVATAMVEKAANLVDLGIAKLHFELAAGGSFEKGNGAPFTKG